MPGAAAPGVDIGLSTTEVSEMQTLLAQAGFDPGAIDGIFGPATSAAITAYQQAQGLDVNGLASMELLERLRTNAMGAAPEPPALPVAPGGAEGPGAPAGGM
jgi:peptidoglycan hydrolase-like protein with peptidoglycan-binding domain